MKVTLKSWNYPKLLLVWILNVTVFSGVVSGVLDEEITISHNDLERKFMVVNQQGLVSTFLPSSPVVPRTER